MFSVIRNLGLPAVLVTFLPVIACSPTPISEENTSSSAQELRAVVGPHSVSYEYARLPLDSPIPAGVAGDEKVVFVGSPLDGRVRVLARFGGDQVGELPAPPVPFTLPLIIHTIGPGRVAILDCGGFPDPGITDTSPKIYEYEYSQRRGQFNANLARTVTFPNQRIGFAEEFVYLGSGQYLVPDAVYGSIWRVASDGSVHAGIVPKTFDRADAIPQMVYCPTMPQITVGGLPFLFTGSTIPGVAGIAVRKNTVYFYSSCAAGLYKFPYSSLFDSRQPWQRAADIKLISSKPANVQVEELLEIQFNPYDHDDKHLYAADALQLRIIRIDTDTGKREVVADDPRLFNFPAALGFLPPVVGKEPSVLVVLSNQQHRTTLLNSAIPEEMTQPPYLLTKVLLLPH